MNIYTIYRATNIINNKVYIGFDSNWPKRLYAHKHAYTRVNYKFYRAIRKYGFNAFVWDVLYQSLDYEHTLEVMEPFFINEYNSMFNGYNIESGGSSWKGDKNPSKNTESLKKKSGDNHFTRRIDFVETRIGETHYHYDHTIYTWKNKDTGEILKLTRFDFINATGAKNSNVCMLIQGKRKSASRWELVSSTT